MHTHLSACDESNGIMIRYVNDPRKILFTLRNDNRNNHVRL